MATTTIRIDVETHAHLIHLSEAAGDSLVDTVRQAADALARQRFADRVAGEVDALHSDSAAWDDYLGDAEATAVTDGIG
jgi:hypothetical protein